MHLPAFTSQFTPSCISADELDELAVYLLRVGETEEVLTLGHRDQASVRRVCEQLDFLLGICDRIHYI